MRSKSFASGDKCICSIRNDCIINGGTSLCIVDSDHSDHSDNSDQYTIQSSRDIKYDILLIQGSHVVSL
ncbi:unnamed protein product [Danaus chrysippus]|uniref:(African queen) hypothetical protein n=1 Tax=Danaus chrysippus TaxID=151541 RepID=A0A8J2QWK0_9NEOP|nr:unnamed protein product [Danaus chrysippus]